jgi:hypothetical protein
MTTTALTHPGLPIVDVEDDLVELDARTADAFTVALLWRRGDPDVVVRVDDARTGVRLEFGVDGRDALHAFRHPFAPAG